MEEERTRRVAGPAFREVGGDGERHRAASPGGRRSSSRLWRQDEPLTCNCVFQSLILRLSTLANLAALCKTHFYLIYCLKIILSSSSFPLDWTSPLLRNHQLRCHSLLLCCFSDVSLVILHVSLLDVHFIFIIYSLFIRIRVRTINYRLGRLLHF